MLQPPLPLPTTQAHKDVFLGIGQKRDWFDLCPWPSASCKPSSLYRSITWNVDEQLQAQGCGLPAPLPSNSCWSTPGASLALRAPTGVGVSHHLRQTDASGIWMFISQGTSTGQFINNAISHRGEKGHICNWWWGGKTPCSRSFIVSVRWWIQDTWHGWGISYRLAFLTYKTSPNNLVMKTSSLNCQLYLFVLPPFWIRVIYILFCGRCHIQLRIQLAVWIYRGLCPLKSTKMTVFITQNATHKNSFLNYFSDRHTLFWSSNQYHYF